MTPAGLRPEQRDELLEQHLSEVAGRRHRTQPTFQDDALKMAFEEGKRVGRYDAVIDYARHLQSTFFDPVEP